MKISSISSNQAFCARKTDNEEYLNFSDLLNSTTKKTSQIADLVVAANSALGSPEEATIKVLNDQLDGVVNNQKSPNWIKKPFKYVSAALVTGLVYLSATKCLKTPGIAIRYAKKHLANNRVGKAILDFASTVKDKAIKITESFKIKNSNVYKSISNYLTEKSTAIKEYAYKKMPKTIETLRNTAKKFKLDKWNKKDYARNLFAAAIGLSSGKRYLDKHSSANADTDVNQDDYDSELNIREAA